jgi:hypothetical protein
MDYQKLEEENKMLRAKLEYIKDYKKSYFQKVHKHKTFYCKCCDKQIKYNSMWYHNHSKKHLENQTKINMDADNYYENEIK